MSSRAETTFKITGWDEQPIQEFEEGGKLTRAHVTKTYTGDLQGEGAVEYLMVHKADGVASFVGYETVTGTLHEKSGGFVFEHRGTFRNGTVESTWKIVKDTGTGTLSGISGEVIFQAGHQEAYSITLNYEL